MRFAELDPDSQFEPWRDVIVRSFRVEDAEAVAAIYASREGLSVLSARDIVSTWREDATRVVQVAERAGQVCGHGKAEWIDPAARGGVGPTGWYLTGLMVQPDARRRGVGRKLTQTRIDVLSSRTSEVWYFANALNRASIALHKEFGFTRVAENIAIPGVTFEGGEGLLFRLAL